MKQVNKALLDLAEFGYIFVKSKSQAKAVAKRCNFPVKVQKTGHGWFRVSIPTEPIKGIKEFKRANWLLRWTNKFLMFLIVKLRRYQK
jgi:hypothetical protein